MHSSAFRSSRSAALIFARVICIGLWGITFTQAQTGNPSMAVLLTPTTSPTYGQPGTIVVSVIGSGFPAGAIAPKDVTLTLEPLTSGTGPTERVEPQAVMSVTGSTRRLSFV